MQNNSLFTLAPCEAFSRALPLPSVAYPLPTFPFAFSFISSILLALYLIITLLNQQKFVYTVILGLPNRFSLLLPSYAVHGGRVHWSWPFNLFHGMHRNVEDNANFLLFFFFFCSIFFSFLLLDSICVQLGRTDFLVRLWMTRKYWKNSSEFL